MAEVTCARMKTCIVTGCLRGIPQKDLSDGLINVWEHERIKKKAGVALNCDFYCEGGTYGFLWMLASQIQRCACDYKHIPVFTYAW